MSDLKHMLENVPGSYDDFVIAISSFASGYDNKTQELIDYIMAHPQSGPSDIIEYVTFEMGLLDINSSIISNEDILLSTKTSFA